MLELAAQALIVAVLAAAAFLLLRPWAREVLAQLFAEYVHRRRVRRARQVMVRIGAASNETAAAFEVLTALLRSPSFSRVVAALNRQDDAG